MHVGRTSLVRRVTVHMYLWSHLLKRERNFYHLQTLLSYRSGERRLFYIYPEEASKDVGNRPPPCHSLGLGSRTVDAEGILSPRGICVNMKWHV